MTDERMARSFPGSLWRLTCEDAPALRHDAAFTLRRKAHESAEA